jgi:hypothetical protein
LPGEDHAAPRIHFIGRQRRSHEISGKVVSQPTNDLGRIARALPMFLAENSICAPTRARRSCCLDDGVVHPVGEAVDARFLPPDHTPPDLIVYLHVDARVSPWLLKVTIENAHALPPPWCSSRLLRSRPPAGMHWRFSTT